jgi:hypothetical protein
VSIYLHRAIKQAVAQGWFFAGFGPVRDMEHQSDLV